MIKEATLRSKDVYKILLWVIKVIPVLISLMALSNTILSYFKIDLEIFSYLGGVSVFTLLFLYLSSYVFRFCSYHRMFIHYITVTWIINIYDYYIGISISDRNYLCFQLIVAGICLFLFLILYKNAKTDKTIID